MNKTKSRKSEIEKVLLFRLITETYKNWRNDRTLRLGAGLAYYGMFAIIPVIVLMFGLATFVFTSQDVESFISGAINTYFGSTAAAESSNLSKSISQIRENYNYGNIGIIGFISLIISSSFIFLALQDALDTIWHNPVRKGWKKIIKKYLLAYVIVLLASTLLLGALLVNSIATLAKYIIPGELALVEDFADLIFSFGSWAIGILILALIFKTLINKKLSWGVLILGSAVTSVLIVVGTWLLSQYLSVFGSQSISGAVGGVFLVLVWIYYEAQILLVGAQLIKTIENNKKYIYIPIISRYW